MSNHLITETYRRDLGTGIRKSVMVFFADKASDDGRGIYASKQTIADELCWSKRVIQTTIAGLVADGLLIVTGDHPCERGHTIEYAINVECLEALPLVSCWARKAARQKTLRGERGAPVKDMQRCSSFAGTRAPGSPKPPTEPKNSPLNPPKSGERKARVRIGSDWQASAIEALSPAAQEAARQWPPGAYAAQAEAFAKFHQGTGRRGADWEALWAAWVIQKHEAVMRAGKSGRGVAAPAELVQARPAEAKPASAAKVREDARSADLHDVLRDQVGDAVWQDWYAPAALLVGDDVLVVAAPTEFHRSWMEERCSEALGRALDTLGIGVDGIRFETSPPSARSAGRGKRS